MVGAQQVHLHKCLQVSSFFLFFTGGGLYWRQTFFLEIWGGEKKKLSFTPKQKNAWEIFVCVNLLSFFRKEKSSPRWIWWIVFSKAWVCQFVLWTKLAFSFRVSNRSRYLVDHYIVWTDFTNLKYSVGVESLVRHWCW